MSFYFSGNIHGSGVGILAEIGSCQMEYAYLAHATGKREHFYKVGGDHLRSISLLNMS